MSAPASSPNTPQNIQISSDNLTDLFRQAAEGVLRYFIEPADVGQALREKVAIEGESLEHLLQEWVEILINMVVGQRMLFNQFKIDLKIAQKGPYHLKAEVLGELFDPQRHKLSRKLTEFRGFQAHLHTEGEKYRAEIVLAK